MELIDLMFFFEFLFQLFYLVACNFLSIEVAIRQNKCLCLMGYIVCLMGYLIFVCLMGYLCVFFRNTKLIA